MLPGGPGVFLPLPITAHSASGQGEQRPLCHFRRAASESVLHQGVGSLGWLFSVTQEQEGWWELCIQVAVAE